MKSYEAMFLMDPAAASDWAAAEAEVRRILQRADAKVLGLKKWDERKLAYPIKRNKRGVYGLCFFEAPPEKISGLERDAQLSEQVLRVLVVRKDRLTPEEIEKALTAAPPPKSPARGDEWSSRPRGPRPGEFSGRDGGPDRAELRGVGVAEADANLDLDENDSGRRGDAGE